MYRSEVSLIDGDYSYEALERWRTAHRELEVVLDTAGVGIVFVKQRTIIRCNQYFADMLGFSDPCQARGQSCVCLYPDESVFHALGQAAYPTMSLGHPYRTEMQLASQDSRLIWVRITGTLVSPSDTSQGSIWTVEDMDAQKKAQIDFQVLLNEHHLVLDTCMAGIVFLRDRIIRRCNTSFEEALGYAPGELKDKSTRVLCSSEQAWYRGLEAWYSALSAGKPFMGEMMLTRKDGSEMCCEVRAKAVDPADLTKGSIWIMMDIGARKLVEQAGHRARAELEMLVEQRTHQLRNTVFKLEKKAAAQKLAESRIQRLAHFDELTGLPNRALLADRCASALRAAQRCNEPVSLMFMDLDNFKQVNDSLGHSVGDQVLVDLAERMGRLLRNQDTVARLGGDEFIILLPQTDANGATIVANKLIQAARKPLQIQQHELTVTLSVGISLFPKDALDLEGLARCADAAMYQAKESGRNSYRFFTLEIQARSERILWLGNALRRALELNQLELQYQPQISLADGRVVGAEALLRWTHPTLGSVSPAEFIPIAESTGLILPIGEWVIRSAVAQLADWLARGMAPINMAVNLSAVQFRQTDFPDLVSNILQAYQLPTQLLELELTEGVAMTDPPAAIAMMDALHARGVRMSIDDFGTGYSSLSYLKRFQVYKLKIDRSFMGEITEDTDDQAIVSAIISMARSLGMLTIAEGVETEAQSNYLRLSGCDEVQGYHFSKPLSAQAFEELVGLAAGVLQA